MFHRQVLCFLLVVFAVTAEATNNTEPQQVLPKRELCPKGKCLADILNRLRGSYQILPGVNITSTAVAGRSSSSDALTTFLKSLTLHVALYNEPLISFFSGIEQETGRRKRPSYFYSTRFRFLTMYTVFALAFALLSTLVGKAVTLSVIALIIAGVAAIRGITGNFGFGAANSPSSSPPVYDIIRRPHVQVQHIHSAEEVYETGTSGGGVNFVYPIRGRAVPVPDSYHPQEIHISTEPDTRHIERHIHST